eukprot:CAMPEP_0115022650 /NCGR_PEP_ID=MMETSP0216-20121206/31709_1 /TAXON_ID=223996 /ORGANISM="Protocruzia adherens, Strain Boccale" /LENGTH=1059 /DNA_ID=CAMNT_0002395439 /DNA_START=131 /DNA_END=3307 /DNA_ORIENTATION=-
MENRKEIINSFYWQIGFLIDGLVNKKQYKINSQEIHQLVKLYGIEAEKFMLRVLFENLNFLDPKTFDNSANQLKAQFLAQSLQNLSTESHFVDYFATIIESLQPPHVLEYMKKMSKALKLSLSLQLILATSLVISPYERVTTGGKVFLKDTLNEYFSLGKPQPIPEKVLHTQPIPEKVLHILLNVLNTSRQFVSPDSEEEKCPLKEWTTFLLDSNRQIEHSFGFEINMKTAAKSERVVPTHIDNLAKTFSAADIFEELGHFCTFSTKALKDVLNDFPSVDERDMARILMIMAKNPSGIEDTESRLVYSTFTSLKSENVNQILKKLDQKKVKTVWNIENFVKVVRELYPNMKWERVARHFDDENFDIKDERVFHQLMTIYNRCKPSGQNFPIHFLFEEWKNTRAQVQFLTLAITNCHPELLNFQQATRKCGPIEGLHDGYPANQHLWSIWCCLDLLEILMVLSTSEYYVAIRKLFDEPIKAFPEHMTYALSIISPKRGEVLHNELLSNILPTFLLAHSNSYHVLSHIWRENPDVVIKGIYRMYREDPTSMNLSRVLDITQDIKDSLLPIATCEDHQFSVHLAILAGKRDFLHFDQWLSERIRTAGDKFVKHIISYLHYYVVMPCKGVKDREKIDLHLERSQLSLETLTIIFENLLNIIFENLLNGKDVESVISYNIQTKISMTYKELCGIFPKLVSPPPNAAKIEELANKYFQMVYMGEMTITDMIDLMTRFKNSENSRETEVFACMIHNLFDEYRFFNKYPEKELKITGELFGAIIQNQLVSGITLGIALRYVLDALRRGGKLFRFGKFALEQFQSRLFEWPDYCNLLVKIENLAKEKPEIIDRILSHQREMGSSGGVPDRELGAGGVGSVTGGIENPGRGGVGITGNVYSVGGNDDVSSMMHGTATSGLGAGMMSTETGNLARAANFGKTDVSAMPMGLKLETWPEQPILEKLTSQPLPMGLNTGESTYEDFAAGAGLSRRDGGQGDMHEIDPAYGLQKHLDNARRTGTPGLEASMTGMARVGMAGAIGSRGQGLTSTASSLGGMNMMNQQGIIGSSS